MNRKKISNSPKDVVNEMIDGFLKANENHYTKVPDVNGFVLKNKSDKVAILIDGGSGVEPLFIGFVGKGLADGVSAGNVFTSPSAFSIYKVAKEIDCGKGILLIYNNYTGDFLNNDMATEMLELDGIKVKNIRVNDNISSAPLDKKEERGGIAGFVMVLKIAGAVSASGLEFDEVVRVTKKARNNTRTIPVVIYPGSMPGTGEPMFEIDEKSIEFGMGFNGEPGILNVKMPSANEIADIMLKYLLEDLKLKENDEICLLINNLGSTSYMELCIINNRLRESLDNIGIKVHNTDLNSYFSSQEMAGLSITMMVLDDELKKYYDSPAYSPAYKK